MIVLALLLAQIAPMPAEPKPIATSISAIRANPKKFDGELVRVHGYVNSCGPQSCLISEHQANAPGGAGPALSIASDDRFDSTVRPLLPTYVEFDARFDARCVTAANCSGRAPELTIVSLRAVVSPEPPPFEN